ncbi:DUF533 domain-containing protein [uncultured Jannaschia sp.]|uniref:DUF533 domain-containing protein n=1 Tax=uncultured Jannaschia sp. TaxID=293347 RepID=UPI00260D6323|nr:DUF533 domain-containing protein [uncultured Jannaschia sp.]
MSLKRTAMRMAVAFAAAKGYQAFRSRGGMSGIRDMLSGGQTGQAGTMQRPASSGGTGGLGGMLGMLGGSGGMGTAASTGGAGMSGTSGGLGGLLGGLAAMAGGGAMMGQGESEADTMRRVEDGPEDEATAAVMVRAIGQAVRADGEIDAEERRVLDDILGEAETDADRAALDSALSEPVNPEQLARDVPRGSESQVYSAALTAIDPDQPSERDFLQRFATALSLDTGEVASLHQAAGKPV